MVAGQANVFFKSGGFSYTSKETGELLLAYEFSEATSNYEGIAVPCRVLDKVSPDRQAFCMSAVDSERPGYYLIHRNGKFLYEPEYAPTNPDTFDEDASFFKLDAYFQGFAALESYNLPNHFVIVNTTSNQIELSEFKDTEEFRISASMMTISSVTKGELFHLTIHCVSGCVYVLRIRSLCFNRRHYLFALSDPCGGLGWLHVSFLLHVKYGIVSYRIVS